MGDRSDVALVTGAARGIGWATVCELQASGWRVAFGDADDAALKERSAEAGSEGLLPLELDVTSMESVEAAVRATVRNFGQLDLLVNNAGIQRHGPLETFAWGDWTAVFDVNLDGVLRCMQAAGRVMLEAGKGAIVNVTSVSAERGAAGRAAYVASKAALIALTRTAAVEWAERGIRVNAVGPGYVDTDLFRSYVERGLLDVEPILARIPMRRVARPQEIARAIRFLGSDDASIITGQVLFADGGFLADYGVTSAMVPQLGAGQS